MEQAGWRSEDRHPFRWGYQLDDWCHPNRVDRDHYCPNTWQLSHQAMRSYEIDQTKLRSLCDRSRGWWCRAVCWHHLCHQDQVHRKSFVPSRWLDHCRVVRRCGSRYWLKWRWRSVQWAAWLSYLERCYCLYSPCRVDHFDSGRSRWLDRCRGVHRYANL